MISSILPESVRETLYNDVNLGAGNFLFKAYELCPEKNIPFLFLEKDFTTPYGEIFDKFSFNQLYKTVGDLAHWYRAQGVKAKSYVAVYVEEGISPFMHFLALNSLGAIPAPINCQMLPQIAAAYAETNNFNFFTFDGNTEKRTGISAYLSGEIIALNASITTDPVTRTALSDWPVDKRSDDIIMICHSSGTTGVPKAVMFGHEQFFNGKRERLRSFIETGEERMLTAFPQAHSAGIAYMMTSTMLALPTLIMTELTGESVAERIMQLQPTIVLGFPRTYVSLIEMNLPPHSFASVMRLYNTGDSAHETHIKSLLALAPKARFFDGFGASELGMSCFWKISTSGSITSRRCVGQPAPYATARIVDELGVELPVGKVGYLSVKSSTLTSGYFNMPFLTKLCRNSEGYWQTGDVGYLDSTGSFYHLDRAVDVVRSVAGPVYSLELEEILQQLPGVLDAHVIGVNRISSKEQGLVAMILSSEGDRLDLDKILQRILAHKPQLSDSLVDFTTGVCLLSPQYSVPVGSTGKVLKRNLRDSFWENYGGFHRGDFSVFAKVLWASPITISSGRVNKAVAEEHVI